MFISTMFSRNQLTNEINHFPIYFDRLVNVLSSLFSFISSQNYAVIYYVAVVIGC